MADSSNFFFSPGPGLVKGVSRLLFRHLSHLASIARYSDFGKTNRQRAPKDFDFQRLGQPCFAGAALA